MILYFTGTGNSLFLAKRVCGEGERLVSIAECMQNEEYRIVLPEGESLGLVFPVYFYTLPTIVREFLEKAEIQNATYVYSLITCGGSIRQAPAVLKKLLAGKGIRLSYNREVVMPDNSMLFYQIPGTDKAQPRLQAAQELAREIALDIAAKKVVPIKDGTLISDMVGAGYKLCSGTKKYYATDACTGCGLCAKNCPQQVIVMDGNRPKWEKEKCCKCSSCINRCPVQAIQYGKGTIKRNRYVNPYEN